MDRQVVEKFKALFIAEKDNLVYSAQILDPDFQISQDDLADETDMTSTELETSMRMRLRSREALYLKKIWQALQRIEEGTFGKCMSCEEEIELKRLEARPTATECVMCKEESERREVLHIDGHRAKSLGKMMRYA